MKKIDYLKYAISKGCFKKKAWMFSAFAVCADNPNAPKYPGALFKQPWGLSFVDDAGELVKIDDSDPKSPLFSFADRLTIDNTWAANCKQPVETSIGTLLYNHIALIHCFGTKIDYMVGSVTVKATEAIIAPRLKDDPKPGDTPDPSAIYVKEYIEYGRSLEYLKTLMLLCSYSSTPKGIIRPTGIDEFKKQLDKKYEGKLRDPVFMAAYEKELIAFDAEFLKDDPSFGKFTSGKITNTARKKLFLTIGAENSFKEGTSVVPITNSLVQGWPTEDDEQYVSMINGTRIGSYARGAETVNGGVAAKYLLRAANNFIIGEVQDCGSKLGISRTYNDKNKKDMVGRTVIEGAKQTKIEKDTDVSNYLGKALRMRSFQYCRLEGDNICKVCAGDRLARYKTGVTIPLTEVSAIILATAMAKMHNSGLSTARLELDRILS